MTADGADELDVRVGDDAGGQDDLVPGGGEGGGKPALPGSVPGMLSVASVIAVRRA
ncbi:hypothetical protein [Streptomyces parvus]|uniref:hypothetical protein n=1 Tax=Streptomyces parvus TaxID=66428 RepID=UPI00142E95FC|nr:hypothetical protein [Streptomyces parvus]